MGFMYRSTDIDPFTGIKEDVYLGYGEDEGKVQFRRRMDCKQQVNAVASIRNRLPTNFKKDDGLFKSASIPPIQLENWKTEKGFDWFQSTSNEKKQWLNRSENAHWKLRKGKL